jgi:HAE1 family hydrophobic/amphiphilic exporter-1
VDKSVKYKLVLTPSRCKVWPFDSTSATGILSSNLDFPTGNIQTREKILICLAGKYKKCRRAKKFSRVFKTESSSVTGYSRRSRWTKTAEKIARVDQKSAIILQIVKQSDANAVAVSEQCIKPSRN